MGEKGIAIVEKLPPGYHIEKDKDGGFRATLDGLRPGLHLSWNEEHGSWNPPGFHPSPGGDPDHLFNGTTGENAVWDRDNGRWINSGTGQPLTSYEQ